jgi:hypothetical protein
VITTREKLVITLRVCLPWLVVLTAFFALLIVFELAETSGGPVVGDTVVPAKTCSDAPKAGTVELHPNGTANAQAWVTYTVPFCSGPVIVVTGVVGHNTAGLPTAHNTLGWLSGTAVSLQLDGLSNDVYHVDWIAVGASQ